MELGGLKRSQQFKVPFLIIGSLGGSVYKINAITGEPVWETKVPDAIHSKGVLDEQKYFIGDDSGVITCINSITGEIIWQRNVYAPIDTPLSTNGELIYFVDEDKNCAKWGWDSDARSSLIEIYCEKSGPPGACYE